MRTLTLALLATAVSAGAAAAQAQVLHSDPLLTAPSTFGADPLLQHRLQLEVQRLEADQRSVAANQFRLEGELASRQLQSTVSAEVAVGPSPDQFAPYRVQGGSPAQARQRAEQLRQQRVERSLQEMRAPSRPR